MVRSGGLAAVHVSHGVSCYLCDVGDALVTGVQLWALGAALGSEC